MGNRLALISVQSSCFRGILLGRIKREMSDKSTIEWTDATWNPVRRLHQDQPRLQHCTPRHLQSVFRGVPGQLRQGFDLRLGPAKLYEREVENSALHFPSTR